MSKFTNKSADIIPIGGKKLTKPEHNIPAFPCYPKMLSTIAEISPSKTWMFAPSNVFLPGSLPSTWRAGCSWNPAETLRRHREISASFGLKCIKTCKCVCHLNFASSFAISSPRPCNTRMMIRTANTWRIVFSCFVIFSEAIERSCRGSFAMRSGRFAT